MLEELGVKAKEAERKLSVATTEEKNKILTAIAKALIDNTEKIVEANAIDLENGKKMVCQMEFLTDLCLMPTE